MEVIKPIKFIQVIILIVILIGTSAIGWTFVNRVRLPYNSEGHYFDEAASVVYHKQAVEVYGLLFIILLAVSAGFIFWIAKAKAVASK